MQDDYFTEAEARALVGRRVKTTVPFADVPAGTPATVTRADPGAGGKGWTVALTWDLAADPHQILTAHVDGEPVTVVTGGKPLTDWFSRDEYTRWIEEL